MEGAGGGGFVEVLSLLARQLADTQALASAERTGALRERVVALLRGPFEKAQAEGRIRPDLSPDDVDLLLVMLAAAVLAGDRAARTRRVKRALSVLLGGIIRENGSVG